MKIVNQMQNRLDHHKMQLEFLHIIWDRELQHLKNHSMQNRKAKKNINLAVKLSSISESTKNAVIQEYFNMFKMVFRIRSTVAYIWDNGSSSANMIKKLYMKDKTFIKMIRIVQRSIFNLFQNTDKNWVAVGQLSSDSEPQQ